MLRQTPQVERSLKHFLLEKCPDWGFPSKLIKIIKWCTLSEPEEAVLASYNFSPNTNEIREFYA
jgi:hypothetical protein